MIRTLSVSSHAGLSVSNHMRLCLLIFCLILLPRFSSGVETIPDTPAGARAQEILDQINGSASLALEEYIAANFAPAFRDAYPLQAHTSAFSRTREKFGKMEVAKIDRAGENNLAIILKSVDKDAYLKLVVQVSSQEPHLVQSLGFAPAQVPAATDAGEIEKGQNGINWDEIDKKFAAKADSNQFSGVVLVAKDGKPIFGGAYGYASKEFHVKNNMETRFNIGSCNKMFTSLGIAQLMEQGKISIDDPIGKYLDYFPDDIASKVTIRQLLQMKAGWGDYWDNEYFRAHRYDMEKVSDYMAFIKDIPLDFEPGTNVQHCNTCFEVLGAIIEAVSGMDYYDYIREHIYKPAGMSNSDSYRRDSAVENMATGYTNMADGQNPGTGFVHHNRYILSDKGTPAGGGYSTAGDLLKYDAAVRKFKLLGPDYAHFAMSGFVGNPGDPYEPARVSRAVGGAPGVCAFYGRDMKNGYTFIMLSNYDLPTGLDDMNAIIGALGL